MRIMKILLAGILLAVIVPRGGEASEKEEFGGLGLAVAQIYDQQTRDHLGNLVVLDVLAATDAQKQGVEKGDVITRVDGVPVAGRSFAELVTKHLRGKTGSMAELTVMRAGSEKPLTFKIKRGKIVYPPEQKRKAGDRDAPRE
ncbi:PDZ domain-containing protein [candidate division FCPU426 bacterium]|nr:PDZ domain-containing protein [candidate division FCPU426 bacterium]